MTPNTQALQRLLDAVEAGLPSPTNWRDFEAIPTGTNDTPGPILAHRAYYGSLDAAKALHDALVPGWAIEHMSWWPGGHWTFHLWGTGYPDHNGVRWHNHTDGRVEASDTDPARAWLIALIRAVMAGERA